MKKKRIVFAILFTLVCVTFVWHSRMDRKPFVKYNPTDGMAMIRDFASRSSLKDYFESDFHDRSTGREITPSDILRNTEGAITDNTSIFTFLVAVSNKSLVSDQAVEYLGRVGISARASYLDEAGLAIFPDAICHYMSSKELGFSSSGDHAGPLFSRVNLWKRQLGVLPPNDRIHVDEDFIALQIGSEVRIYSLAHPPSRIGSLLDSLISEKQIPEDFLKLNGIKSHSSVSRPNE